MAYDPDVPANSSENPSSTEPKLRANFQELETFLNINHEDLNAVDQGKHKFLQMPEQASAPATAANEGGLYTKVANSLSELFWRPESSGTEVQMTSGGFSSAASGFTFLPGGLIMQWGTGTATAGGTTNAFSTSFGTVYQVLATNASNTNNNKIISVGSFTTADFIAFASSAATITISYIAIGSA